MSDIEKKYPIPEAPEYDTEIRSLQNTDPANADEIFNPLIQKMIDNIHAVKLSDDEKAKEDLSNVLDSVFLEKVKAVGGDGSNLDADTVDGKHASDFAPSGFGLGTHCSVIPDGTDLNNLPAQYKHATGFFTGGTLVNKPKELNGWIYLFQISGSANHKVQMAFNVNGYDAVMGDIFIRQCKNNVWTPWKKPDADTVDGKHASDLQNYLNLSNLPLALNELENGMSGADFDACNVDLKLWHGFGIRSTFGNPEQKRSVVISSRDGTIKTIGQIYADTNKKVWHEGNDGSGSGLDADTLDGKHASDFQNYLNLSNAPLTFYTDMGGADFDACNVDLTLWHGFGIRSTFGNPEQKRSIVINSRDGLIKTIGQIYADTNKKVWHEGNDGSGSGLDADLLDGKHAADFIASDDGHEIGVSFKANEGVQFRVDVTQNVAVAKAMNADTVDGKHAADFAPAGFGMGTNCIAIPDGTDLNNLPAQYKHATGFFQGGTLVNKPKELNGWIYLFQMSGSANYKVQIAFNVNGSDAVMGDIFIRQCKNNVWTAWKKPDASTVGGKGVNVLYSNCSATAPTTYLGDNVQYQVY